MIKDVIIHNMRSPRHGARIGRNGVWGETEQKMRLSSSRRGMSQGSRRRARAVDAGVVLGQRLRKRSFAQWVCLNGILRIFTLQKCIAHPVSIAIGLCKAGWLTSSDLEFRKKVVS